jgi:hypothetical protein
MNPYMYISPVTICSRNSWPLTEYKCKTATAEAIHLFLWFSITVCGTQPAHALLDPKSWMMMMSECSVWQTQIMLQFTHCNLHTAVDYTVCERTSVSSSCCSFIVLRMDPSALKFHTPFCYILQTYNIFTTNFHELLMNFCHWHISELHHGLHS